MWRRAGGSTTGLLLLLLGFLISVTASAAELAEPARGPVPSWVVPQKLPPLPKDAGERPVTILLMDQQTRVQPDRTFHYTEVALHIGTAQGLGAGTAAMQWLPEIQKATAHKITILRNEKPIDILAGGQRFNVSKRETNMEAAVLDGVLTASLFPEGLQVGDTLIFAFSTEEEDPLLPGRMEFMGPVWLGLSVERGHLRVSWPADQRISMGMPLGLPWAKAVTREGMTSIELTMEKTEPLPSTDMAPARFLFKPQFQFGTFTSWQEIAKKLAPLYQQASQLPPDSDLWAEINRIKAASNDPVKRTEAALALVQQQIRYVALVMGTGRVLPADAQLTWSRRFGDCKGKTALLLALLRELGVTAEPVVVQTRMGDGLDQRIPMLSWFDHVLVRATIAGKSYWLDGTRPADTSLALLRTPDFRWGLPLVADGSPGLMAIEASPLTVPDEELSLTLDMSAGLRAPAKLSGEKLLRGDRAFLFNLMLTSAASNAREQMLRSYWGDILRTAEFKELTFRFDPAAGELLLKAEGTATFKWPEDRFRLTGLASPLDTDPEREQGDKEAPVTIPYPTYVLTRQKVLLPAQVGAFRLENGEEVNETFGGHAFTRKAMLDGNVVSAEASYRSLVREIPIEEAVAGAKRRKSLNDKKPQIVSPEFYWVTPEDKKALTTREEKTVPALFGRAVALQSEGKWQEALAVLDEVIALNPNVAAAKALRASVRMQMPNADYPAIQQELDKASQQHPDDPLLLRIQSDLFCSQNRFSECLAILNRLIEKRVNQPDLLAARSRAYEKIGDSFHALEDFENARKSMPFTKDDRLRLIALYERTGQYDVMAREIEALIQEGPGDAEVLRLQGNFYAQQGRWEEADRAYTTSLAREKSSGTYLARAVRRAPDDLTGRRADLEAGLAVAPDEPNLLYGMARLLADSKDTTGALAILDRLVEKHPDNAAIRARRGVIRAQSGDRDGADKDFIAARMAAKLPVTFVALCEMKAKAGVALESAVADCDRALAVFAEQPEALAAQALILLRLDRLDEALAGYDHALRLKPNFSDALWGRAIIWARKGDKAKSAADQAAARKWSTHIEAEFTRAGLTL
ncbi:Tetratricopeptide repeat-containing protein [Azospirillum sp. RU38E]|nr:Tetratricopeptide repeat-containing protein [Azospirillum sp. RU38E]SNT01821.1 Tetratricopeptide repeat-containing protein [Azospirillum sp. RU37A]